MDAFEKTCLEKIASLNDTTHLGSVAVRSKSWLRKIAAPMFAPMADNRPSPGGRTEVPTPYYAPGSSLKEHAYPDQRTEEVHGALKAEQDEARKWCVEHYGYDPYEREAYKYLGMTFGAPMAAVTSPLWGPYAVGAINTFRWPISALYGIKSFDDRWNSRYGGEVGPVRAATEAAVDAVATGLTMGGASKATGTFSKRFLQPRVVIPSLVLDRDRIKETARRFPDAVRGARMMVSKKIDEANARLKAETLKENNTNLIEGMRNRRTDGTNYAAIGAGGAGGVLSYIISRAIFGGGSFWTRLLNTLVGAAGAYGAYKLVDNANAGQAKTS